MAHYTVQFYGGSEAPRLQLVDDCDTFDLVRAWAESAAQAIGPRYWGCVIFDTNGKLVHEFKFEQTFRIKPE